MGRMASHNLAGNGSTMNSERADIRRSLVISAVSLAIAWYAILVNAGALESPPSIISSPLFLLLSGMGITGALIAGVFLVARKRWYYAVPFIASFVALYRLVLLIT